MYKLVDVICYTVLVVLHCHRIFIFAILERFLT